MSIFDEVKAIVDAQAINVLAVKAHATENPLNLIGQQTDCEM